MEQSEMFCRQLWCWWDARPIMHVEPMFLLQLHAPGIPVKEELH